MKGSAEGSTRPADTRPADAVSAAPWRDTTGEIDAALIAQWQDHLDRLRAPSARSASLSASSLSASASPSLGSAATSSIGVSVVVSYRSGDDLATTLRCLAEQTLPADCFEIVVVTEGVTDDVERAAQEWSEAGHRAPLRVVGLPTGRVPVRAAALASVRRPFAAFVAAGDRLSPSYLRSLLAMADDASVVVAHRLDVSEIGSSSTSSTATSAGEVAEIVAASEPASLGDGSSPLLGTLVPTISARQAEEDLPGPDRPDVLLLLTLLTRHGCQLRQLAESDGATYQRTARDLSGDADCGRLAARIRLIADLDGLATSCDETARPLVRRVQDAEYDRLNAHLRNHPDDHARVVALIDQHNLDYLPSDRLNAGLARALAVAYCFAPYNDSSAVVMAKRVRERGEVVDVVYNKMDGKREIDPSMCRISGPFVETEIAVDTPTYFSAWPAIEAFCAQGLERVAELERVKGPYERLYSRVMWPASHFLAALYKTRNPSVVWTAEFSDPASRDVTGQVRSAPLEPSPLLDELSAELKRRDLPVPQSENCLDWCEYLAYALADRLVFTNENQRDYMLGYCPVEEVAAAARAKSVISPHPTLPPAFYSMARSDYALDPSVVNIAYFGTFYATRGLDDVLTALARLDPATRELLRLHVFTSKAQALRERVKELGIVDLVRVNPYVRYLVFLNLTTRFDCLIVNDALTTEHHQRNPYLPSKWSDYHGSGRRVWGLVEEGSPLSARPLDFASPVGDVGAAQDVLRKIAALAENRSKG
jgi:glycosyltransferase involved in cell wall biosynthesis